MPRNVCKTPTHHTRIKNGTCRAKSHHENPALIARWAGSYRLGAGLILSLNPQANNVVMIKQQRDKQKHQVVNGKSKHLHWQIEAVVFSEL